MNRWAGYTMAALAGFGTGTLTSEWANERVYNPKNEMLAECQTDIDNRVILLNDCAQAVVYIAERDETAAQSVNIAAEATIPIAIVNSGYEADFIAELEKDKVDTKALQKNTSVVGAAAFVLGYWILNESRKRKDYDDAVGFKALESH